MPIDLSPFAIRQVHVDLPSDNLRVDTVVARKLFKGAKIQKCDRIGLYLLPPTLWQTHTFQEVYGLKEESPSPIIVAKRCWVYPTTPTPPQH